MVDEVQTLLDRLYWSKGPCCAGCDWWQSFNSKAGLCTRTQPVRNAERWAMLGIESCSLNAGAGHIATPALHVCGEFKDNFDWSSLPLFYRKAIGCPVPTTGGDA